MCFRDAMLGTSRLRRQFGIVKEILDLKFETLLQCPTSRLHIESKYDES